MKKILVFLLLINVFLLSFAEGVREDPVITDEKSEMSYAFGMAIASDLQQIDLQFNYTAFIRGFREVMENQNTLMSMDEALDIVDAAIQKAMNAEAESFLLKETAFLSENAAKPGVYTTASGLQYLIITEGDGDQPTINDVVMVNYIGYLTDGTVFDSSYERGEPEEFPLMGVIPGWSEGLQLMRVGGSSRLFIPSKLAYGSRGAGGFIPPNSVIIFDVELLDIIGDSEGYYQP